MTTRKAVSQDTENKLDSLLEAIRLIQENLAEIKGWMKNSDERMDKTDTQLALVEGKLSEKLLTATELTATHETTPTHPTRISPQPELPRVGSTRGIAFPHFEDPSGRHDPTQPLVVLAENHVLSARLRHLSVESLYKWIVQIQQYEHQHGVRVNRAAFVDLSVLNYIALETNGTQIDGLRRLDNEQLKILISRKLALESHTPKKLCEVAKEVISFPPIVAKTADLFVDRARQQLAAVPVYLANLTRFDEFCREYGLLPAGWPYEDNRAERGPQRLHEVLRATIAKHAPMAWALIEAEAYTARRLTIIQLVATLRAACQDKITSLAAGADMIQKLVHHQGNNDHQEDKTGAERHVRKQESKVQSKHMSLHHLEGPSSPSEEADTGSEQDWKECNAEDPEPALGSVDLSTTINNGYDLNAISQTEKANLACHSFIFNAEGCHYERAGKKCPYSHDVQLCLKEAEVAKGRLLKRK